MGQDSSSPTVISSGSPGLQPQDSHSFLQVFVVRLVEELEDELEEELDDELLDEEDEVPELEELLDEDEGDEELELDDEEEDDDEEELLDDDDELEELLDDEDEENDEELELDDELDGEELELELDELDDEEEDDELELEELLDDSYVKPLTSTAELLSGLTSSTSTVPAACGGVSQVTSESLTKVTFAAAEPPKFTAGVASKPDPVTVTGVPPETSPDPGETELIVGIKSPLRICSCSAALASRSALAAICQLNSDEGRI